MAAFACLHQPRDDLRNTPASPASFFGILLSLWLSRSGSATADADLGLQAGIEEEKATFGMCNATTMMTMSRAQFSREDPSPSPSTLFPLSLTKNQQRLRRSTAGSALSLRPKDPERSRGKGEAAVTAIARHQVRRTHTTHLSVSGVRLSKVLQNEGHVQQAKCGWQASSPGADDVGRSEEENEYH